MPLLNTNDRATKGELTKQRILEAAAQMFWKSSYHNVRVDKIVELAEVNKASFYQYFKNKEHAALECVDYMFSLTREHIFEGSFAQEQDPIKRLEEIYHRIYMAHKELKDNEEQIPGCPFMNMGSELATDSEIIRQKVEQVLGEFYVYQQRIYEDAKAKGLTTMDWEPELVGRQLQGILNGAMSSAKIRNRPEDITDALVTAKTIIGVPG
ncbi:hypothetical protein A9Q99_17250 [Gammaproteobacteria bacterium 45_16_T64]|nr:hypothetical protein A9Q99_17250 [Gammaproteobacteria bacterium 45_16_T64]